MKRPPHKRVEDAWEYLPFYLQVWVLATIYVPYWIQKLREALMRRKAAFIFAVTLVLYLAFFWVFADVMPGRVMLVAGIFAGGIMFAALIAMFLPWGNGNGGDHKNK